MPLLQKKKVEEVTFVINAENGSFITSSAATPFVTFNEFLLRKCLPFLVCHLSWDARSPIAGFLEIEPTDKVAVVDALGYWIESGTKTVPYEPTGSASSLQALPRLPSEDKSADSLSKSIGSLTAKERSAVLEAINTALAQQQNENMMPGMCASWLLQAEAAPYSSSLTRMDLGYTLHQDASRLGSLLHA